MYALHVSNQICSFRIDERQPEKFVILSEKYLNSVPKELGMDIKTVVAGGHSRLTAIEYLGLPMNGTL